PILLFVVQISPTSTFLPYTTLFRSIIQMKGFEHENDSKKGQLREQFAISLHMAYIGVQSLNIKSTNSNETREHVIEQNEETLNHVLKELRNAQEALNEDTIIYDKLVKIIDKDRKSTRLNSSHVSISYAVFCLKKK